MPSGAERAVSFIANCIAIAGLAAAVLGWLGVSPFPEYVPPNDRVAKAIIVVFCLMASYGVCSVLNQQLKQGQSRVGVAVASLIALVPYAFAVAYLGNSLSESLDAAARTSVVSVAFATGWLAWFFLTTLLIVFPMQFPNGFDFFRWITGIFRSEYWLSMLVMIFYLAGPPWLLTEFGLAGALASAH